MIYLGVPWFFFPVLYIEIQRQMVSLFFPFVTKKRNTITVLEKRNPSIFPGEKEDL